MTVRPLLFHESLSVVVVECWLKENPCLTILHLLQKIMRRLARNTQKIRLSWVSKECDGLLHNNRWSRSAGSGAGHPRVGNSVGDSRIRARTVAVNRGLAPGASESHSCCAGSAKRLVISSLLCFIARNLRVFSSLRRFFRCSTRQSNLAMFVHPFLRHPTDSAVQNIVTLPLHMGDLGCGAPPVHPTQRIGAVGLTVSAPFVSDAGTSPRR